jgi:sugar O-acyltransferase (sialic acid O-acetyltransferase NeuD family)
MAATKIGIVGFGVLGRQLLQMITARGACEATVFDDACFASGEDGAVAFSAFEAEKYADLEFYVALGYKHFRRKQVVVESLVRAGRRLPPFVHPSAYVDPTTQLGAGAVLFPRSTLGPGVSIASGAVLHCAVTLAHDCVVGPCSYLAPGVVVSGFTSIGARVFVGTGAVVADRLAIGDDATIGIGTCVTRDVEVGASVIGNPMRVLDHRLDLHG